MLSETRREILRLAAKQLKHQFRRLTFTVKIMPFIIEILQAFSLLSAACYILIYVTVQ